MFWGSFFNSFLNINLKNKNTPIFIFSHLNDEIYPYSFQLQCLSPLEKKIKINKFVISQGKHAEDSPEFFQKILQFIFK